MIYADYNGSAPLLPEVKEYLINRIGNGPYANPNAIHSLGKKMLFGMEKCRRLCGKVLGATTNQIVFNSGASEGITHIFHSVLTQSAPNKNIIITSGIEHSAVVQACKYYSQKHGFEVLIVDTLENGVIDIKDFEQKIRKHRDHTALVTVMAANNETGVIQPWQDIAKLCNELEIPYFSDTTQYIGKTEFNFKESGMDYAVMSGHKIGALIGSGLVLAKDPTKLKPLIFGGGQENGHRGGTQNYIGIETMAVALEQFDKTKDDLKKMEAARIEFENAIKAEFPDAVIIGDESARLATTTLISLPGIHGQGVQIELESQDIFVTTSSACSDNQPETSKVLKSMGIQDDIGRGVVRISLCVGSGCQKYKEVEAALSKAYNKLRKIKNF